MTNKETEGTDHANVIPALPPYAWFEGVQHRFLNDPVDSPAYRGNRSNAAITARNGGVQHQFLSDIGGCSANYR